MRESGYYPPGAEQDPSAPWNESNNYDLFVEIDYYGEVVLIQRTYIDKSDWEDETKNIDLETFEEFCCIRLNLDHEKLRENKEIIDLKKIKEEGHRYKITTSHGEFKTTYDELEDLA